MPSASSGVRPRIPPSGDFAQHVDEVGGDGQLSPAPVHHDRQPDAPRPTEVAQRGERRPDRPSGEEDVVHQQDVMLLEGERDAGLTDPRNAPVMDIVPV